MTEDETTILCHFVLGILLIIASLIYRYKIRNRKQPVKGDGGYLDVETTEMITVPDKISNPKRIEGLTVCVGYSDFLAWTLPFARTQFDHLVVVTSSADIATQRLCEYWNVECVITDVFYENGDVFNKGKAVNEGLKHLKKDGWVLHFDADIYLLPRTREVLNLIPLDPKSIYSIDRLNCGRFGDWAEYLSTPESAHGNNGFLDMKVFSKGARLVNLARDGFVNIGFFQLWSPSGSGVNSYPCEHQAADRSDTLFAYNWKREHRHLIPELICIHLESESSAVMGANWQGRTTPKFGIN